MAKYRKKPVVIEAVSALNRDKIKSIINSAETKLSDLCYQAKQDWQRLTAEGHENVYAASVRYETLRMVDEMMANVGVAIEKELEGSK